MPSVLISVRLLEPRYHGSGGWPPAPFRLFQALVASAGLQGPRGVERVSEPLQWLERLPPPTVLAPRAYQLNGYTNYVPNNQADTVKGDPRRLGGIREAKRIRPWALVDPVPLHYLWPLADTGEEAASRLEALAALATRLYQLGRGVDMACAWAERVEDETGWLRERLSEGVYRLYRPVVDGETAAGRPLLLAVPRRGSLRRLRERHRAGRRRHRLGPDQKKLLFQQLPPPRSRQVVYDAGGGARLYVLRPPEASRMVAWPLEEVLSLLERVRQGALQRLERGMGARGSRERTLLEQALRGARPGEARLLEAARRVRIVPVPSVAHPHADRAIRRLLVEVPAGCPVSAEDVFWAFEALRVPAPGGGEALLSRAPADAERMVRHLGGGGEAHRAWRSVTPLALPARPVRRGQPAAERAMRHAVRSALRHAGIVEEVEHIHVQREPFQGKEPRAERFARPPRFGPERLWHVRLRFARPVRGPLLLGDGRFLGLGLMVPQGLPLGRWRVHVQGGLRGGEPLQWARALRRAVMARYQASAPTEALPPWVSGHEANGLPLRRERSAHLFFVAAPEAEALFVLAPHLIERRAPTPREREMMRRLDEALASMRELRGEGIAACAVRCEAVPRMPRSWRGPSCSWRSETPYVVTRHLEAADAHEALREDLRRECARHGLPRPSDIEVLASRGVRGLGLSAELRLRFEAAVHGPLLLGRTRHLGGGLFRACRD